MSSPSNSPLSGRSPRSRKKKLPKLTVSTSSKPVPDRAVALGSPHHLLEPPSPDPIALIEEKKQQTDTNGGQLLPPGSPFAKPPAGHLRSLSGNMDISQIITDLQRCSGLQPHSAPIDRRPSDRKRSVIEHKHFVPWELEDSPHSPLYERRMRRHSADPQHNHGPRRSFLYKAGNGSSLMSPPSASPVGSDFDDECPSPLAPEDYKAIKTLHYVGARSWVKKRFSEATSSPTAGVLASPQHRDRAQHIQAAHNALLHNNSHSNHANHSSGPTSSASPT